MLPFYPDTEGIYILSIYLSAFSFMNKLVRFCYGSKQPQYLITYNSKHLFFAHESTGQLNQGLAGHD